MTGQAVHPARSAQAWLALRAGLMLLAVSEAATGGWALVSPRGFYAHVPGVDLLPPYNEHLVTDVGGLSMAVAIMLAVGAVTLDRLLVRTTLASYLLFTVPHLVFHLAHLHGFGTGTAVAQTIGLAIEVLLPLGLLAASIRGTAARSAERASARSAVAGRR
jgi:hypothetical protein